MKQQQLEDQLEKIRALAVTLCYGASPLRVAQEILSTYEDFQGPSGGMVDTSHSKCDAAMRVGSSPTSDTKPVTTETLEEMHRRVQAHTERCREHHLRGCYMCHA